MKWIKLTDKVPDMIQTVLLSNGEYVTVGWNESYGIEDPSFYSCERCEHCYDITHWMELPEAPKR